MFIVGDPSAGKATLFRALAGLWLWETGSVILPPGLSRFSDDFANESYLTALDRVGLRLLKPDLVKEDRGAACFRSKNSSGSPLRA